MEEINKKAKFFSAFLEYADDELYTMSELMHTGFFESEKEALVFFTKWFDMVHYVTNETYKKHLPNYLKAIDEVFGTDELLSIYDKEQSNDKETKE